MLATATADRLLPIAVVFFTGFLIADVSGQATLKTCDLYGMDSSIDDFCPLTCSCSIISYCDFTNGLADIRGECYFQPWFIGVVFITLPLLAIIGCIVCCCCCCECCKRCRNSSHTTIVQQSSSNTSNTNLNTPSQQIGMYPLPETERFVPCYKCNTNTGASAFCPACGTNQTASFCTQCGSPMLPSAKFCPSCGCSSCEHDDSQSQADDQKLLLPLSSSNRPGDYE
eukprot:m.39462 g.39462  ORF g.39462 m.39462 type:complete len:227 (+) comp18204_c0_seq2:103-783(+)